MRNDPQKLGNENNNSTTVEGQSAFIAISSNSTVAGLQNGNSFPMDDFQVLHMPADRITPMQCTPKCQITVEELPPSALGF